MQNHITDLAVAVREHVVPYLPLLIEGASKGIGKSAGEITVKEIWGKLKPKLNEKDDTRQAVAKLVAKPDSEARKAVFQEELEELLMENPDLAQELAQILAKSSSGVKIDQSTTGSGNLTIGVNSGGIVFSSVNGEATPGK
jgi:hypothetical protein